MGAFNNLYKTLCLPLVLLTQFVSETASQCSLTESFEKVSRSTLKGVPGNPLFSDSGNTVTFNCLQRCRESGNCKGLLINYKLESCFSFDRDSSSVGVQLQPSEEPVSYFEKICINAPQCGKGWILERVVGFEIEGYDDIVLSDVPSRIKCAEMCLRERGLMCRSAEYHMR
ncbi:hypothetical protein SK128_014513 [Halocaridina rubra]|uniref:Apple domain-containing protein n=1 Tax=Halocaridina rubra TaxID=373956 RepID=A0AAN8X763_HALRR